MGHHDRAEHAARLLAHVIERLDDLDPAGFAPSAGMDLRFDHPDRAAKGLRRLDCLIGGEGGYAARRRRAV